MGKVKLDNNHVVLKSCIQTEIKIKTKLEAHLSLHRWPDVKS